MPSIEDGAGASGSTADRRFPRTDLDARFDQLLAAHGELASSLEELEETLLTDPDRSATWQAIHEVVGDLLAREDRRDGHPSRAARTDSGLHLVPPVLREP